MYAFHVTLHARPNSVSAGPVVQLAGLPLATLKVEPTVLAGTLFPGSFEMAEAGLNGLPRMYCEPDGSFVWVSSHDEAAWQVDGNLYDRDGRLLFVDLKGSCPPAEFDRLLSAFGWPAAPLVFQLTREAVLLDEATFRQHAERGQ